MSFGEALLSSLQIASQSDLKKLDRKLSRLSKKLTEIEKAASGSPAE